jgi:hypothetical protein
MLILYWFLSRKLERGHKWKGTEGFLWNMRKAVLLGVVHIEGMSKWIFSLKEGIWRIHQGFLLGVWFQIEGMVKGMHNLGFCLANYALMPANSKTKPITNRFLTTYLSKVVRWGRFKSVTSTSFIEDRRLSHHCRQLIHIKVGRSRQSVGCHGWFVLCE